jgi:pimeloyl-ACP methyl ester carboxylesterase
MDLAVPVDVGRGAPIVILPGFAMSPSVYRPTAELLARRARVVVPDIYRLRGGWSCDDVVAGLRAMLDARDLEMVTFISHSFAGGVALEFATKHLERVEELVFCDTLAVSRGMSLAREALRHPLRMRWLVTPEATRAFMGTVIPHLRAITEAAWWGFRSERADDIERIALSGVPTHVLWANRDSVLSRRDGMEFASDMQASFDVVDAPPGTMVDHDWMFEDPELFVRHLEQLTLKALA